MNKYYYDLHIHSCLSPCGENDMTPANIAGMAFLKELDIIALTDHNSCKNCTPFIKCCKKYGLLAIPGMEINTEEEIHAVCLFPTLEASIEFDKYVYSKLPNIKNNVDIYGHQYIVDENDNIIDEVPNLLINATTISIINLKSIVSEFNGVCFPAHIDKSSYSILSVLGSVPEECNFNTFEFSKVQLIDKVLSQEKNIEKANILTNSDAHYLWDISEKYNYIELKNKSIKDLFYFIR